MPLVVKTNVTSLTAQRHLNSSNRAQTTSLERLASGFRVNSAADDAAGLALSEEMKAAVRSLAMASRNASDAVSVLQTTEGALGEIGNVLVRMRELVVQSHNGALTNEQKGHIQTELQQLKFEVANIAERTQFNGQRLLDDGAGGPAPSLAFQVGVDGNETVDISFTQSFLPSALGTSGGLTLASIFVATGTFAIDDTGATSSANVTTSPSDSLDALDRAILLVSGERARMGTLQNRLDSKIDNLAVYRENLEAANSRIRDVDFAAEMANLTKSQILVQAGTAMLTQANALPQGVLSLLGGQQ